MRARAAVEVVSAVSSTNVQSPSRSISLYKRAKSAEIKRKRKMKDIIIIKMKDDDIIFIYER